MSLSTSTNRYSYTGNGIIVAFAFPALFYDNTHLAVYLNGVLQSSGFTTTGAGVPAGGTVTFVTAPAAGVTVTLLRTVPNTQQVVLGVAGAFPAKTVEKALDLLTMGIQQGVEVASRAVSIPVTDTGITTTLPDAATRASKFLFFDSLGNITTSAQVNSGTVTFTPVSDTLSGTGIQTVFTISAPASSVQALVVSISGVVQKPTTDFTLSGSTLTFSTAPATGTNNILVQNFGFAQGVLAPSALPSYPLAGLPSPGTAGRLAYVTDSSTTYLSGVYVDNGSTWNYAGPWSATGPYAIGGGRDPDVAFFWKGAFQGTLNTYGAVDQHILTANPNKDAAGWIIGTTLVEAASGVHNELAGMAIDLVVTPGAATTNSLMGLLVSPIVAPAGTVLATGIRVYAPTGATTNYALWVNTGNLRFDGIILSGAVGTGAVSGDIVLPIINGYRSVTNAGTNTFVLIKGVNIGVDAVHLAPAGNEIVWGRALVALGGGAAPTVGTIGGSGPAVAAQNSWMQVRDSGGVSFWVPVWK